MRGEVPGEGDAGAKAAPEESGEVLPSAAEQPKAEWELQLEAEEADKTETPAPADGEKAPAEAKATQES